MAYFRCGGVKKKATQTYTATSRGAALDMGADNEYRYVNTNGVPNSNSGTYVANSRGAALDMGATNTNRYVNTNDVPNLNSGTYTFPQNSTGATYDMGAANTNRFVNATNVYNKGKADVINKVSKTVDYGSGATIPKTISGVPVGRMYEFDAVVPTQSGNNKCLFSFGGSNTSGGCIFLSRSNFIVYARGYILNQSISLDGNRHKYAIVLTASTVKLYVDGALKYSYNAVPTSQMLSSDSFVYGQNESDAIENWSGGTLYKLVVSNQSTDFLL